MEVMSGMVGIGEKQNDEYYFKNIEMKIGVTL